MKAAERSLAAVVAAQVQFRVLVELLRPIAKDLAGALGAGQLLRQANVVELLLDVALSEGRDAAGASEASGGPVEGAQAATVGPETTIDGPACPNCGACSVRAAPPRRLVLVTPVPGRCAYQCTKCRLAFNGPGGTP